MLFASNFPQAFAFIMFGSLVFCHGFLGIALSVRASRTHELGVNLLIPAHAVLSCNLKIKTKPKKQKQKAKTNQTKTQHFPFQFFAFWGKTALFWKHAIITQAIRSSSS